MRRIITSRLSPAPDRWLQTAVGSLHCCLSAGDVEYAPQNMDRRGAYSWRWICMASAWLGIGLFDATETVVGMRAEGMHHNWPHLFATTFLFWLPWTVATPLILRLGRQYSLVHWRRPAGWLVHLSALLCIAVFSGAWNAFFHEWLNPLASAPAPGPFLPLWFTMFWNGLLAVFILYSSILALSYVLDFRERLVQQATETANLNAQLSQAQLDALRRQIEPHFLFNALNAIAGLVREKRNDDAVDMIAALSDFLRRMIDDTNRQQVSLEEEVQFLQRYLDIEKVRFAERLQVQLEVPRELRAAQVPSLILQPMVENAIKHGIGKRAQGGAIRVSAFRANGRLTLRVYNDGPQLPAGWESTRTGIGIANVRTRLQRLYGGAFELHMQNQEPDGVEVSVSVPFREG